MSLKFYSLLSSPTTWFVFIIGLIIGSFLNVCIKRIPKGSFFSSARSQCPGCNKTIPFYANIPVLSFLFLLGKARCCGMKISLQYPIVEILTGVLFMLAFAMFPFFSFSTDGAHSFYLPHALRFLHFVIFHSVLIVCSAIDFELMIIPDVISLPMIALSPVVAWFHPDLTMKSSLLGVLLGGGIVYAIAWTYFLLRKMEGIGMGDAKLLAFIGGWLGIESILPTLFWGSILGSLVGIVRILVSRSITWKTEIPFGPFLAVGAFLHMSGFLTIHESFASIHRFFLGDLP